MRKKGAVFGMVAFAVVVPILALGLMAGLLVMKIHMRTNVIIEHKSDDTDLLLNVLLSSTKNGVPGIDTAGRSIAFGTPHEIQPSWAPILREYWHRGRKDCIDVFYLKDGNRFIESNYYYIVEGFVDTQKCKKRFGSYALLPAPYNAGEEVKILVMARD